MNTIISNRIYVYNATKELFFWCRDNLVVKNPTYETLMRLGKQDQIQRRRVPESMQLYIEKKTDLLSNIGSFGDLVLPVGCLYAIWPMIKNYPYELKFNNAGDISCKNDVITQPLFDYQEEAVQKMLAAKSGVLIGGTGSGKTNCGIEIIHRIGKKFLWLTHTKDLVRQSYERMKKLYPNMQVGLVGDGKLGFGQDGTIATIQTMATLDPEIYKNDFDVVVTDECFSGDTKILTDNGFKRFDSLNGTELVAQYENGQITYVKPIRHIHKTVDKYMTFTNRQTQIVTTLNHNMVATNYDGKEIVRPAIDFLNSLNGYNFVTTAKINVDLEQTLTAWDRIQIMLQADGCLYYSSKGGELDTYKLEFSKQRKIERFKVLCEEAGLEYKEYKPRKFENKNWDDSIKFCIKVPKNENRYKVLTDFLEYPRNSQYALDILDEIAKWDGHQRTDNLLEFDSISRENVEFIKTCAFFAGKQSSHILRIKGRGNKRVDIYRVYIGQMCKNSYGKFQKEIVSKPLDTYCVEVPTHKIVVEKDGFIFVSGNCHHISGSPELQKMFVKVIEKIPARYKFGLTATKNRNDSLGKSIYATTGCNPNGEFAPVWFIKKSDTATLTAEHVKVELNTPFCYEMLDFDGTFNYTALVDYLAENQERNAQIVDKIVENAADSKNKQLVLCHRIGQCEELHKMLLERGIASELLVGKVTAKKRESILKEKVDWQVVVATVSLAKEGLDLPNLNILHLASCIGNESDTIQSVGRIERYKEGKGTPIVYDYVDVKIPYLVSRYKKRVNWLRKRT